MYRYYTLFIINHEKEFLLLRDESRDNIERSADAAYMRLVTLVCMRRVTLWNQANQANQQYQQYQQYQQNQQYPKNQ